MKFTSSYGRFELARLLVNRDSTLYYILTKHFIVSPGAITVGHVIKVLPFRDTIDIIEVTGVTLKSALEHSVAGNWKGYYENGKFLQVSGKS